MRVLSGDLRLARLRTPVSGAPDRPGIALIEPPHRQVPAYKFQEQGQLHTMVATRAARATAAAASPRKPRAKSPARRPAGRKKSPAPRKATSSSGFDVRAALTKALGGGLPGAVAMVLQVVLLMWLRTTVNYQMRHGGSLLEVIETLYAEGGIQRVLPGHSTPYCKDRSRDSGTRRRTLGCCTCSTGLRCPFWPRPRAHQQQQLYGD